MHAKEDLTQDKECPPVPKHLKRACDGTGAVAAYPSLSE
jgi:hypothetical protein